MELISVLTARALWFVELRDINPRGIALRRTLLPALAERYRFAKYPYDTPDNHPTDDAPGIRYKEGEFTNAEGVQIMVNLVIHDDGLVADTRSSTKDSDAFLVDVLQWAVKEFGLIFRPDMVFRKGYLSELNVSPARSLGELHPGLVRFADTLSSLVSTPNYPVHYEPTGVFLSGDPTLELKPAAFRFERRLDAPFSTNRYFSQAPLQTDLHLKLLEEFEGLLVGGS